MQLEYLDFKFEGKGYKKFGYGTKYKVLSTMPQYDLECKLTYSSTGNSYGINEVVDAFEELIIEGSKKGIITVLIELL